MKFLIRSADGEVINKVENPGAVVDCEMKILLKIGEFEDMEEYYDIMRNRYLSANFVDQANSLAYMHLPKDQEEIDKIFQNTGYIEKYMKDLT